MRNIILIIVLIFLASTANSWGIEVKLMRDRAPLEKKGAVLNKEINWVSGVMNNITKNSVTIDETEYRLSPDSIIRFSGGERIKNISFFKGTESANVKALVSSFDSVLELIIESRQLRQ